MNKTDGRTDRRQGRIDGRTDRQTDRRHGRIDGRTDRRTDRHTDGRIENTLLIYNKSMINA